MDTHAELLKEIDAFLARTGMTATRFGIAVLNDGHFVADLRAGRSIFIDTADKIRAFMRDYRPPSSTGLQRDSGDVSASAA